MMMMRMEPSILCVVVDDCTWLAYLAQQTHTHKQIDRKAQHCKRHTILRRRRRSKGKKDKRDKQERGLSDSRQTGGGGVCSVLSLYPFSSMGRNYFGSFVSCSQFSVTTDCRLIRSKPCRRTVLCVDGHKEKERVSTSVQQPSYSG